MYHSPFKIINTELSFEKTTNGSIILRHAEGIIGLPSDMLIAPSYYYEFDDKENAENQYIELNRSGEDYSIIFDWRNCTSPLSLDRDALIEDLISNFFFKLNSGGSSTKPELVEKLITQSSHGFDNDFVYHNGTIWLKALADDETTIATHFVKLESINTFYAIAIGEISISGLLDDLGNSLVPGEYYFLSQTVEGKVQRNIPISGVIQCVLKINLLNNATILIDNPFDNSQINIDNIAYTNQTNTFTQIQKYNASLSISHPTDIATKEYVDALQNSSFWDNIAVATISNVTILTDLEVGDTIDDYVLLENDRVAVINQTNKFENGIYNILLTGAVRSIDADTSGNVNNKKFILLNGTINGGKFFFTTSNVVTLGVDDINFAELTGINDDHSTLLNRDIAGNHAKLIPLVDDINAIQITKVDGVTSVLNIDTINNKISINTTAPSSVLEIKSTDLLTGTVLSLINGESLINFKTSQIEDGGELFSKIEFGDISNAKKFTNFILDDLNQTIENKSIYFKAGDIDLTSNGTILDLDDVKQRVYINGYLGIGVNLPTEKIEVDGKVKYNLTENYLIIGDVTNKTTEIATSESIAGTGTLIIGQKTITDIRILTSSIVLMTPSTVGTLNGVLKYTLTNGQCVFSSTNAGDDVTFSYQIIF